MDDPCCHSSSCAYGILQRAMPSIASLAEILDVIRSSLERLHGKVPARVGNVVP